MNPLFIIFVLALLVAQFALPRRFAFAPLLVAACQFQNVPVIDLGVSFTICKLVIMAGLFRAARERTLTWSTRQPMDVWIAIWACWTILSGFAHNPIDENPITIRLSLIYNVLGTYLYARAFLSNPGDFLRFSKCLALIVVPLALAVVIEKFAHKNFYEVLGMSGQEITIREGRVRAAGPFAHPILLGTFAASSMILLVPLRRRSPRWFLLGTVACAVTVFCSASSGPIMTLLSGLLALALWPFRTSVGWIRRAVLFGIVGLQIFMQAPVWFLMARIDLAGGSTGWHRAELISAAVNHLDEWWLTGTDYTRHWMPYGVTWSGAQTDITNYYLQMGVTGGLPLMLSFIVILIKAFQLLGRRIRTLRLAADSDEFMLWCVGATIFAHCFTFISISYFDQSFVEFWVLLGAVPGLCAVSMAASSAEVQDERQDGECDRSTLITRESQ